LRGDRPDGCVRLAGAVADSADVARGDLEPGRDSAAVAGGVRPGGAGCQYRRRDSASRDPSGARNGYTGRAPGAQTRFVRVGVAVWMAVARDAAFHRIVVVDWCDPADRSAYAGRDEKRGVPC